MKHLTKHFTIQEFTGTTYKDLLAENIYYALDNIDLVKELAEFAEEVRTIIKSPMIITSAIRSPKLNKAVGGSKTSDHLKCMAIDFVPSKIGVKKAFEILKNSRLKFNQLILERNTWIHISLGDKKEVLIYDGQKYTRV